MEASIVIPTQQVLFKLPHPKGNLILYSIGHLASAVDLTYLNILPLIQHHFSTMEQLNYTKIGESLTVNDLNVAEQEMGITFPFLYREFLLRTNGGVPMPANFSWNDSKESLIDYFLQLSEVVSLNLYHYKYTPEIHENNLIIIAATWAAPVVCLGIGQENLSKVYLFEFYPELISNSFNNFISEIHD